MLRTEPPRRPDPAVLADFERDGFVVLRDALPADLVEPLRSAAMHLRDAAPVRCSYRGPSKLGFRSLVSHSPDFLQLVANPRILPTVVALLTPNIRLLSSHLITYDALAGEGAVASPTDGGKVGGQGWHRDDVFHIQGDIGFAVPRLTVHCAYYLSDLGPAGGTPTKFLPGSHQLAGPLDPEPGEDPPGTVVPDLGPSDVVLFENRTWHAPGALGATDPRITVMNQYGYRWLFPIDDPYDDVLRRSDLSGVERALLGQPDRNDDGSMAKRRGVRPLVQWYEEINGDGESSPERDASTRRADGHVADGSGRPLR